LVCESFANWDGFEAIYNVLTHNLVELVLFDYYFGLPRIDGVRLADRKKTLKVTVY
jgi:hypothetical protein